MAGVLIAFCGKGGSGKTTLAAMVIHELLRTGKKPVLAVDADPNATLALTLGASCPGTIADLRDEMLEAAKKPSEIPKERLMDQWLAELLSEHEGFDLLTMGRPEGQHCYCYVNGLLRRYLKLLRGNYAYVVVDCEAGMEYLSRLTVDDANTLVLVAEPTGIGLTTAKRIIDLSTKLPIQVGQRLLALNKVQAPSGGCELADLSTRLPRKIQAVVHVPFDTDLAHRASCEEPIDDRAGPAAREAIVELTRKLRESIALIPKLAAEGACPMNVPKTAEKWTSAVNTVTIGATKEQGGTRKSTVTVGGAGALPFLSCEGSLGHRAAIAMEVWDGGAEDWPNQLTQIYGDVMSSPGEWARKAVDFGADLICLRLMAAHPDAANRSPEECAKTVEEILRAVAVPLVIWGCGVDEKDTEILPAVSAAARGENCLVGAARETNYRTVVAVCHADKHKLLAESPLDINIAKQVNILCQDAGFPLEEIVIFPTTGALGYGIDYVYSIQERGRLAGLSGDKLLAQPVLCDVGFETWRAKEARMPPFANETDATHDLGGAMWEAATAAVLLQAGAELLVMRHPKAVECIKKTIDRLTQVPSKS